jgi:CheY-like chemotaxis protein
MIDPALNPKLRVNLGHSTVLLIDDNPLSLDILWSVFAGFGVREKIKCSSAIEAMELLKKQTVDLIVVTADMPAMDGYDFVTWLRRDGPKTACRVPVIMLTGHAAAKNVSRSRDCGANFVVAKPIAPAVLLERVVWLASEDRPFIECDGYLGPDRRFKNEGPPFGTDGRRRDDVAAEVGEATEPNMSQFEIDSLVKPTKAKL